MSDLLYAVHDKICLITLNRAEKRNAFDAVLLTKLTQCIAKANSDDAVRVIILNANGKHFCAGADLGWMQQTKDYTEEENLQDALILAKLMYQTYNSKKPILTAIQGAAFGGGAGLVAASTIAIAAQSATFCFSEVKLGLIPAVISPYVINAIGQRIATKLFVSAEIFDAKQAHAYQLVHDCVNDEQLLTHTLELATVISRNAKEAVQESLSLLRFVKDQAIAEPLVQKTAALIAKKRISAEGQKGIMAFLNKVQPNWN